MSQIESTFGVPDAVAKKTSGLAIASLVCSLIFCCPLTTLLGPLLGLGAIVSISMNPARKGKGLALTAILLGIIFTVGQGFCARFAWDKFYRVMFTGPNSALYAGFAGDAAGFRNDFTGAGATASDEEVVAFINELRNRYGEFTSAWISPDSSYPGFGQKQSTMTYRLTFTSGVIDCDAEVVLEEVPAGPPSFKLGSLVVHDPDLGDLTYPASEAEADEAVTGEASETGSGDGG